MGLEELIKDYLKEAHLMQVATAHDNQPWVCSVYFAYDDDFNLYWLSTPQRRHSQEIASNEKVAGTIVLPHTPGDKVRGIQFEGIAHQMQTREELTAAMDIYAARMGTNPTRKADIIGGKDAHVPYKITPKKFVLFDERNFPNNPRQEYVL